MGSAARRMRLTAARRGYIPAQRVVFACSHGHHTVTERVDHGQVPNTLGCRWPQGCPDPAAVNIGNPDPWPHDTPEVPGWEWYRPDTAALDRMQATGGPIYEHVAAGGLLIRPRTT